MGGARDAGRVERRNGGSVVGGCCLGRFCQRARTAGVAGLVILVLLRRAANSRRRPGRPDDALSATRVGSSSEHGHSAIGRSEGKLQVQPTARGPAGARRRRRRIANRDLGCERLSGVDGSVTVLDPALAFETQRVLPALRQTRPRSPSSSLNFLPPSPPPATGPSFSFF